MQEKMTAARAKSTAAALSVLTDEQKNTIDELKGAKFELDMRALMGAVVVLAVVVHAVKKVVKAGAVGLVLQRNSDFGGQIIPKRQNLLL